MRVCCVTQVVEYEHRDEEFILGMKKCEEMNKGANGGTGTS